MVRLSRIMVVGSSGYLGRSIKAMVRPPLQVTPTHFRNPYFANSVSYAFPEDDLGELASEHDIELILFVAEIEKKQQRPEVNEPELFRREFARHISSVCERRVVYISSDGIFDGTKGLYTESDAPMPKTPYGINLKSCEEAVAMHCSNHCIIRPSYLYGHSLGKLDSRLERTRELCSSGHRPAFFDNMYKSPIHVCHAASLIMTLALSDYVGVVHVGGPRMSVYEFHRQGMEALGVRGEVRPTTMPDDPQLLRDTSLDVSLCKRLTSFEPLSIKDSFTEQRVRGT